jgi:threonine dehydrogenase-like Zn-dependent dehydrogenase
MRAAVIKGFGEAQVMTVEDPVPGPRDVVVEVAACGICGTDLHILDGEFAPSLPIIPGHEKEITITGSMAVLHSFERAAELFISGVLDPDVFISDRIPLDDYAGTLVRFKRGVGRKILLTP